MNSTWSRLKARADLLSATNNSFSPPYQSTSHGHLDVPRRSCCPTTPDPYNAATAPEFYLPAIPASLAASKTPASTTPASPAAIAPEIHPATATPVVHTPSATFDGPPSPLPHTLAARPPEQSSHRVLHGSTTIASTVSLSRASVRGVGVRLSIS